jgi:hypothetical protein
MNKQISGIFFLFLLSVCVSAQTTNRTVEKIGVYYKDVAEKARLVEADSDQGKFGELVMNELKINSRSHQWRAVGIYGQTYKFFYRGGNDERHPYPDQLVIVINERKISDRNYREEYLFSDAGALVFYSYKDDIPEAKQSEIKVYFAAGRAVRIEQDGRSRDRMTKADIFSTNQRLATAAKLMQFFKRSIDL